MDLMPTEIIVKKEDGKILPYTINENKILIDIMSSDEIIVAWKSES